VTEFLVFSDLDGTLLNHQTYSFREARPALDLLAEKGIPLILASSKTAAEVAELHAEIGLGDTPAIIENGAGIYRPGAEVQSDAAYRALRMSLDAVPDRLRAGFRGFGDMTVDEIAKLTGLTPEAAARARQRRHSEPGLWLGNDADRDEFLASLAGSGITGRSGGRFLSLSYGRTKADGLLEIAAEYRARRTLALGDAPNDVELLQAADIGVIVRNDHGPGIPPLTGESEGHIRRTTVQGPAGWAEAVTAIVNEMME